MSICKAAKCILKISKADRYTAMGGIAPCHSDRSTVSSPPASDLRVFQLLDGLTLLLQA